MKVFISSPFPRTDLRVTVDNMLIELGFALTTWIAFHPMEHSTMIMGDLVLLDSEIKDVVEKLKENGINITALHNHIVNEEPSIMFMHFEAIGDAVQLSKKMKEVISLTKTLIGNTYITSATTEMPDWTSVETILVKKGNKKGNLISFGFPRKERILEEGHELPKTMGMHTAITFQMVNDKAIVTGDYVMTAKEVNEVISRLVEKNITITALHNHMINEEPQLFFMHFWGYDKSDILANGIRAALEKTNSAY